MGRGVYARKARERTFRRQLFRVPRRGARAVGERTRDAPPQIELPYDQRQRNVRGAFRCTRPLAGLRIAVVDDVMTTGATLDEMARTLKAAGAAYVENWVIARTLRHA